MKDQKSHSNQRIKLDELQRTQPFRVPDGYFDKLPTIIQARVAQPAKTPAFAWPAALRIALPVLALAMMLAYFGLKMTSAEVNVQAMIDEVPTEELVSYLAESDITTDELLSLIDISELDIDGMFEENIQLLDDAEWDEILDEFPEFEHEI